jgi:MFS family permease
MTADSRSVGTARATETAGETAAPRRFSALRNRNFALLWIGLIISNSGSWMQNVAQGLLVYELTHSPFWLGVVAFARAVPMIVLPPMGGVIADRTQRLKLLKVTQTFSLLVAAVLATLVGLGVVQVWQIVVLSFLSGAVNAFDQPTRQALLPDLVKREDLTNAIALNSAAWQGSALFGPSLAGLVIAVSSLAVAFYLNAVSFLAVVIALFLMRGVPERSGGPRRNRGLLDDLAEGLRYAGKTRLVLTLLVMAAITSIFGRSYQQLMPVFAREVLGRGATGLGLMMSAPGAGTLVGATVLGALGDLRRKGVVFFAGIFALSLLLIGFTLSRSFVLTVGILFLVGVVSIVFSTMLTTMLQLTAPAQMRGRVMSLVTVTMQGLNPVGALLIGALATAIGTPRAVALGVAVVMVAALLAVVGAPDVREFGMMNNER